VKAINAGAKLTVCVTKLDQGTSEKGVVTMKVKTKVKAGEGCVIDPSGNPRP
jgi:hypothetical protein